mgnify:CR=1 FL=1
MIKKVLKYVIGIIVIIFLLMLTLAFRPDFKNKDNTKDNPDGIWDTNIFGKTIEQIVNDGIYEKTHNITKDNMDKIGETIEKVMNENSGLVCLIV